MFEFKKRVVFLLINTRPTPWPSCYKITLIDADHSIFSLISNLIPHLG